MTRTKKPTRAEQREMLINSLNDIAASDPQDNPVSTVRAESQAADLLLEYIGDDEITAAYMGIIIGAD